MNLRRIVLLTHRWLGLASSVVLSIVGVTGAVLLLPESVALRRFAGPLHQRLALGSPGSWVVIGATGAAVLLQVGGAVLWWKRKRIAVRLGRGWRQALDDLHHSAGALGIPVMVVLALTGAAMPFVGPDQQPALRRLLMAFHTGEFFPIPIKLLYAAASAGFLIQGLTGIVMWWTPWRSRSAAGSRQRAPRA